MECAGYLGALHLLGIKISGSGGSGESGESGEWDRVGIFRFREENRDGVDVHGGSIAQKGRGAVALQILKDLQRLKSLWRGPFWQSTPVGGVSVSLFDENSESPKNACI